MLIGRRRHGNHVNTDLNVIPLIDVVFFLLVFYVIATTFTREASVEVQRPSSSGAASVDSGFVAVAVTSGGAIQIGDQALDLASTPEAVRVALNLTGTTRALVVADREVPTGLLLSVMDACRTGGAERVEVAAERSR